MDAVEEFKEAVEEDPTSPMTRVKLGQAYEEVGDKQAALKEYQTAVQLDSGYNRAKRNVERLQKELGVETTAPVAAPAPAAEASDPVPAAKPAASGTLPPEVAAVKAEGNEFFKAKKYKEAVTCYAKAIKIMDALGTPDAKLYTNRAAAHLGLKKYVGAAHDGQMSMDIDPSWWKGYWYRGQALTNMCRGKGASTAMAGRAEQAMSAFQGALSSPTLPANKKMEVEGYVQNAKQQMMMLNPSCSQQ